MCPIINKKIKVKDNHGFIVGDNIRIFGDKMIQTNIINIEDNLLTVEEDLDTDEVFFYGKEVNDFHTIKKEYLYTLCVPAIQELDRQVVTLQTQVADLLQRISNLES